MVSSNPHIRDDYSPLDALAKKALTIYAEFNPHTIDSDTLLLFVELANEVVGDVNTHPYRSNVAAIPEYVSPTDAREIDDRIMQAGLIAYYAMQQASAKVQLYVPAYYKRLNRTLWHALSGGSGPIQMRVTDDGTKRRSGTTYSAITGLAEES